MARRGSYRPGVRPAFCLRRKIRLGPEILDRHTLTRELNRLTGFNDYRLKGPLLWVEYDAGKVQFDDVVACLARAGVSIPVSGLQRWRIACYRATDANVRANASNTSSSCCSQSPLRYR